MFLWRKVKPLQAEPFFPVCQEKCNGTRVWLEFMIS